MGHQKNPSLAIYMVKEPLLGLFGALSRRHSQIDSVINGKLEAGSSDAIAKSIVASGLSQPARQIPCKVRRRLPFAREEPVVFAIWSECRELEPS